MIQTNITNSQDNHKARHCEERSNPDYCFFIFAVILLFTACETPISIKLPEKAGTTVIEGWIENDKTATVVISRSMSFYSTIDLNTIFNSADTTATVIITDDLGNSETLQLGFSFEHIYGLLGRAYIGKTLKGIPGHTYNLYVKTAKGEEYTAQTYIPEKTVRIDSMAIVIKNPATDTALPVRVYISDDPTSYDCYRFFTNVSNLKIQGSIFMEGFKRYYSPVTCFDDLTFNGQNLVFELYRSSASNLSFSSMSREERREFYRNTYRPGDTIHIRSALTDIYTYKYWFALQLDMESGGMNPMVVPGHYKTNIIGKNVTGIWSGYHARYDVVVFPK